jgi:hypothetical protein
MNRTIEHSYLYSFNKQTCISSKLMTRNAKSQRKYIWKISESETDEASIFPSLFSNSSDTAHHK